MSRLGALWCALAVVSLILIAGLDYAEVFIFPVLAVEFPEVVTRYGDGVAMPSIAFVVLLISVVAFSAGLSGFLPFVAVKIGAGLFGLGLAWTGWSLMRHARSMS